MNAPEHPEAARATAHHHPRRGFLFGVAAYGFWGFLPIYFKLLKGVAAVDIVAHRVLWSLPFLALLITAATAWDKVRAAFVQPATGTYGTMGAMNILGPGSINIDMGLARTFRIREKQSIQFRAEAFNVPNHVNPGNPNVTFTDSNFGRILTAADGRTMQIALKYVF